MTIHRLVSKYLWSTVLGAIPGTALGVLLLAASSSCVAQPVESAAKESEIERPVHPFYCEEWRALVEERLASDDPLERSLGEIYGNEEFSWCQTQRVRVREERESRWDFNLPGMATLAEIMRLLAIAGLLALVIWALWHWRRQLGELAGKVGQRRRKTAEAARQTPMPEQIELPVNISAEAREFWNQGRRREAVSLLYRGALGHLLAHVRSAESRTEREVQRLLHGQGLKPATLAYMDSLISCWQRTAWAHQPPVSEQFEQLLEDWPRHCRPPTRPGGGS